MHDVHEAPQSDEFEVYLRHDGPHAGWMEVEERAVVRCPTYEEARRVRQEFLHLHRKCVIRYVGPAGGGD
jgi:hypothetical protein